MADRILRRLSAPSVLAAAVLALALGGCSLRPHANVTVRPQDGASEAMIRDMSEVMAGLGYKTDEFTSVRGKPVPTEEVAFRALHPGLRTATYADALRHGERSTVLERPGSKRMHFTAGLTEAWVTIHERDVPVVDVEMIQATNRFLRFDEFGAREYQLLVQELRSRFGPENVRPQFAVD